ncbi:MAG UNVERIFIED_CONTAM: hypothetical protein LVR18_49300 [Planctomycetaceae bacterium]
MANAISVPDNIRRPCASVGPEANFDSVNGFMVQHHRHQHKPQGFGIATLRWPSCEECLVIADLFFQGLAADNLPE